jgi:hypothetical protein
MGCEGVRVYIFKQLRLQNPLIAESTELKQQVLLQQVQSVILRFPSSRRAHQMLPLARDLPAQLLDRFLADGVKGRSGDRGGSIQINMNVHPLHCAPGRACNVACEPQRWIDAR